MDTQGKSPTQGRETTKYAVVVAFTLLFSMSVMCIGSTPGTMFRGSVAPVEFLRFVSMDELHLHDDPEDCWVAFHGRVYDLTGHAQKLGRAFLATSCGTYATEDDDGKDHGSFPQAIGILEEGTKSEGSVENCSGDGVRRCAREDDSEDDEDDGEDDSGDDGDDSDHGNGKEKGKQKGNQSPAKAPAPPPQQTPQTTPQGNGGTACSQQVYSLADISAHPGRGDCWYALYGTVYDLTKYVDSHPGGSSRILQNCGTDATRRYENAHSQNLLQSQGMSRYEIGQLGSQSGCV